MIGHVRRSATEDIDADREKEDQANNRQKDKNRAKGRNSSMKRYLRKRKNIIDERKHENAKKEAVQVIKTAIGGEKERSALSRFVRKE